MGGVSGTERRNAVRFFLNSSNWTMVFKSLGTQLQSFGPITAKEVS